MTFLEAAVAILKQAGRPLHIRELTERSIKLNLLSHLGRAPEATMRSRLNLELKKGSASPIVQKGQDIYGLRQYGPRPEAAPAPRAVAPAPVAQAAPKDEDEDGKKRRRRRGGRGRKRPGDPAGTPAEGTAIEVGTPEEAIAAEELAGDTSDEDTPAEVAPPSEPHPIDLDALQPIEPPRYARVVELPGDEVLTAEYADEIAAGEAIAPAVAGEVVDEHTADEDRPMLAEIKDESSRDRRRGRKGKETGKGKGRPERPERKEREKKEKGEKGVARERRPEPPARERRPEPPPRERRPEPPPRQAPEALPPPPPIAAAPSPPPSAQPPAPAAAPQASAPLPASPLAVEGGLVEVALHLLQSLNDPRPVHARQLVAMALKRKLLTGDPEELWRAIRSALAGDARARQAQGLRIRARHQGAGLFTLTTARLEDEVRAAEDALATVWRDVGRATREALRRRTMRLPLGALEQLARMYLEHCGVIGVERIKRAGETWYLGGSGRRGARPVKLLIAVRAGGGDVGRQAVGELRAGVQVRKADEGLLLAPGRLDNDGVRELEGAGPPVTSFTGDSFAEELIACGVGVVQTHLPVAYLDIDLLAELQD